MKTLVKIALPVLALAFTATAEAVPVTCTDAGIVDSGFTIVIEPARESVEVLQHDVQGARLLQEQMPCARQDVDPLTARAGDVVLKCRKESSVDHGLVLNVRSPDANGDIRATLMRQTIAGPKLVSEMRCSPKVNMEEISAEEAVLP